MNAAIRVGIHLQSGDAPPSVHVFESDHRPVASVALATKDADAVLFADDPEQLRNLAAAATEAANRLAAVKGANDEREAFHAACHEDAA